MVEQPPQDWTPTEQGLWEAFRQGEVYDLRTGDDAEDDVIASGDWPADHPYGFAAFTVDPGTRPGGTTSIQVTYYTVGQPTGEISPLETFVLQRPRSDGH